MINDKTKDVEQIFTELDEDSKNLLLIIAKSIEFAQAINKDAKKVG